MALPLDQNDKHFAKLLAIKQAVASSILVATARVRQDRLKPAQEDHMKAVLAQVQASRRGLAVKNQSEQEAEERRPDDEPETAEEELGSVGSPVDPGADQSEEALTALLFS